jgi:hypothetical protein
VEASQACRSAPAGLDGGTIGSLLQLVYTNDLFILNLT